MLRSQKTTSVKIKEIKMHTRARNSLLPSKIIVNILSRLPIDSVLQCKRVCKTWRCLICHPSSAHKHLHQLQLGDSNYSDHSSLIASKVGSGFLFTFSFKNENGCQLYYGEYNDQPSNKLKRINQPPTHHHVIVGSCNGLICYSIARWGTDSHHPYEPAYICNPITSEYVKFPGLKLTGEKNIQTMVCGFGYHHSVNKYKIVKIYYIRDKPLGKVQVYTLGSGGGWRDVGETAYSLRYTRQGSFDFNSHQFGRFVNGALHWLDQEQKIVSFDLADEKLYLLSPPPFVRAASVHNYFELQVLGGCLCFVHRSGDDLDIWFLRKNGGYSSYENDEDYDSLSWIKEFSVPVKSGAMPFSLTNSGQVLFRHYSRIFCYDPETTAVSDDLIVISNDQHVSHVVSHMNSLVSLKGLGEICCIRKRYDVNPAPKEILIKQQRKDKVEIDVNPSLTMTRYSGEQAAISPIHAICCDLDKSIPMPVGVEVSQSRKVADRNGGESRKRKETSIHEKIAADVEIVSDETVVLWDGETWVEEGTTLPLMRATKRFKDGSDMSDPESEKTGSEPDSPRDPGVVQPRERSRGTSLMPLLGRSERVQADPPLPEYASPQLCPPNFVIVAGFPVLPEYKDLYIRVITSKGHMASDAKVKSMYIQATMVSELLETIQQMSKFSCCDVTSTDLQRWRATVDTASAMEFRVSWLDDQLHLLDSQIRDAQEQNAMSRSLEAEVRGCEKKILVLRSKKNEARRALKAAKVDEARLIEKVAKLKANLASSKANDQMRLGLTRSALGSCLDTPH